MSYDLDFLLPAERRAISSAEFRKHFETRPNYTVDDQQAMYENEQTGCHFWFDWNDPDDDDSEDHDPDVASPEDGLHPGGATFHINYVRPFWFADEAEPEIREFVESFDFRVDDAQASGMGRGDYSSAGFMDGWRTGNRFGLSVMIERQQFATASAAIVAGAWRWNYAISDLQRRSGDDLFVPRIVWVRASGGVGRLASWSTPVPTLLPDVEWFALGRPTPGLLAKLRGDRQDSVIRPADEVAPFLTDWQLDISGGRWRTGLDGVDVGQLFRGGGLSFGDVTGVPAWEVFEAEELASIKQARFPRIDDLPPESRIEEHGGTKVIFIPNPPADE